MVDPLPLMAEEEEQLERCADWLCRWLQSSQLIHQDDPAFVRRVTPHSLSDPAFIAAAIRGLSSGVPREPEEMAEQSEVADLEAAATCLSAVLKAERSVDVDAASLITRAVQAGLSDLEPLGDIVDLWRHVLMGAVCCEAKEKHIECIQQLPHDLQAGLVQTIEVTEQFLMNGGCRAAIQDERSCPASSPRGIATPRGSWASADGASLPPGMDEDREALLKEIAQLRERNQKLEKQVSRDGKLRQRRDDVLEGDFESFEKIFCLEKQLRESNDRIQELEREVRNGRQAADELPGLRDELECARAREAEHVMTKVHLDRYKQRLEEAGDLKVEVQKAHEHRLAACRERDAMAQEISQLKSTGQHLDAWKAKAHDLEIHVGEVHAQLRGAEARESEAKKERQRLSDEKSILERKVQEVTLMIVELQEGQRTPNSLGEMCEPFTAELRERMQELESRNALLEEQVTMEGTQRVAQLVVEVESLHKMREHFEQRAKERAQELVDTASKLESTEDLLKEVREQCRQLEAQCEAVRASKDQEIVRCKEERQRVEDERDSFREEVENLEFHNQEIEKNFAQVTAELTETQDDVSRLQDELQDARECDIRHGEERRQLRFYVQSLSDLLSSANTDKINAINRAKKLEAKLGNVKKREAELSRRLQTSHVNRQDHEPGRADLVKQEEISAHTPSELLARIQDLEDCLEKQAAYRGQLSKQLDNTERRASSLEELVRRVAPLELQRFEEEALCFSDISEVAQLHAENLRLHAQVYEELPSADNAAPGTLSDLPAQTDRMDSPRASKHRRLRDCPTPHASLCPDAFEDDEDECEPVALKADERRVFATSRRGSTALEIRQTDAPRSSILKKPKVLPSDFDDRKENCNFAHNLGKHGKLLPAPPVSPPRTRRAGLIGKIV